MAKFRFRYACGVGYFFRSSAFRSPVNFKLMVRGVIGLFMFEFVVFTETLGC